jgi:hypothetical protein
MKKSIFFSLFILAALFSSCKKDKVKTLFGDYYGQTHQKTTSLQEIFTDPTTSHFEYVTDSLVSTDFITVSETGGGHFILDWQFTGFDFVSNDALKDTIRYELSFSGGYRVEKAVIFFDTDKETLYYKGVIESQLFGEIEKTELSFTGVKK